MCDIKNALILVIDDNPDNLFLMEMILTQDGYRVEKAGGGREGIAKVHKLVPDLIILDMMMPDMTGFEVIEEIRPHKHLSHIPILICTANKFIRQKNIENIEGICYKPINIEDILVQINSLISCCDGDKSNKNTVVIDVNDKNPLYLKH